MDACGGGCGSRYHRDARGSSFTRRGDLPRKAHLLRSGQFHLQRAAYADLYSRTAELGERRRVRAVSGKEPGIDLLPAGGSEYRRRGAAGHARPLRHEPISLHARLAGSGHRGSRRVYSGAAGRAFQAVRRADRDPRRHRSDQVEKRKIGGGMYAWKGVRLIRSRAASASGNSGRGSPKTSSRHHQERAGDRTGRIERGEFPIRERIGTPIAREGLNEQKTSILHVRPFVRGSEAAARYAPEQRYEKTAGGSGGLAREPQEPSSEQPGAGSIQDDRGPHRLEGTARSGAPGAG